MEFNAPQPQSSVFSISSIAYWMAILVILLANISWLGFVGLTLQTAYDEERKVKEYENKSKSQADSVLDVAIKSAVRINKIAKDAEDKSDEQRKDYDEILDLHNEGDKNEDLKIDIDEFKKTLEDFLIEHHMYVNPNEANSFRHTDGKIYKLGEGVTLTTNEDGSNLIIPLS